MEATIREVQEYWDARPCNIMHSRFPVGTLPWSVEVTDRKYFVEPHIPKFAQFERWRGKGVLEIGCGIGTDTMQFVLHGAQVDAVDVSFGSLTLARSRCEKVVGLHVMFFEMNAEEQLPAAGGDGYDLAYSFGVLHHTPNPEKVLQLVRARLKDDGELRIMLYARWSLKKLLGQRPEAQDGCPVVRWYTEREARELLVSEGFEVLSVEKTHIFPWRVRDYVKYRYVKTWPFRFMPKRLFGWLEKILGHHLLIVARKAR